MPKQKDKKGTGATRGKRKKLALGRGLDALIPDVKPVSEKPKEYFQCDIDLIQPNRFQPRRAFSKEELGELSRSIEKQGIIQPLLVRENNGNYELITGERRLRAAKMIGLRKVPVIIRHVADSDLLEMSIVENIQRKDLNAIEEADAYHRLISEFKLTQDQAADRVGKSRSAVANTLRLRQLPDQIKDSMIDGSLSMGHARALLGAKNPTTQNAAWRIAIAKMLSVRGTESLIKRLNAEKKKPKKPTTSSEERHFADLADELSRHFGTKVEINRKGQKGSLQIEFYSDEDLNRLIDLLKSDASGLKGGPV